MTLFGYCMFYIAVDLYIMLHIMPLVTGIIQGIIWSFSVCTCGSSCGLSSWICLQTFCHNERIHRVSRQCETSCDPVVAMDERKICDTHCTCGCWCGWACACLEREHSRTFCDKCCKTLRSLDSSPSEFACVLTGWNLWQNVFHIDHTCVWKYPAWSSPLLFHHCWASSPRWRIWWK